MFLSSTKRNSFPVKYTSIDIALLLATDNAHKRLSGPATKNVLTREYNIFNKKEYANISKISIPHIYNLRSKKQYISTSLTLEKTKPIQIPIGQRKKPDNMGIPGFLRVDTVHQGDLKGEKGVYHINIVDEITQWELIGCVEKISEYYLTPLLESLIESFPFNIINFHSDNGSEYINYVVSKLLNKLLISQTKSRPRHSNDNGLVETKNGSIIRKYMGRNYIPQRLADNINDFYQDYLNIYLNYHRPCGYPTLITDSKGKQRKIYLQKDYTVPYEKLKSLPNADKYLKKNTSFKELDKIAYAMSDNDFAEILQNEKQKIIKNFKHVPQELMVFQTMISCSYVD
ncbi:MAG: integrase [Patescibacteria group bacterium]